MRGQQRPHRRQWRDEAHRSPALGADQNGLAAQKLGHAWGGTAETSSSYRPRRPAFIWGTTDLDIGNRRGAHRISPPRSYLYRLTRFAQSRQSRWRR